jgi:hypothetical protein
MRPVPVAVLAGVSTGSRGLHGLYRLMAGSVSTELVHRAHFPVLVVHDHERNV